MLPSGVGVRPRENWSLEVQLFILFLLIIEKEYLRLLMGPIFLVMKDWQRQA